MRYINSAHDAGNAGAQGDRAHAPDIDYGNITGAMRAGGKRSSQEDRSGQITPEAN